MVKTPEESDKLIYVKTKFAMFVAELATDLERTRIFDFFSDPDTVLLEYADPNLHFALLPRIIWGKKSAIYTAKTLLS